MKDPFGGKEFYDFEGTLVEKSSSFTYEVCLYKYWKYGYCILGSKFYRSNKQLPIKKKNIFKKQEDFIIEKEINLIGVPEEFIKEMNLKIHEPRIKKSRKNGQTAISKR